MARDVYSFIKRYKKAKIDFTERNFVTVLGKKITIRNENKELALKWLEHKENKLKNANGYNETAEIRYSKTLHKEITKLKNLLFWFNDLSLKDLTEDQLKTVYEGLEKGSIKGINGKPLSEGSRNDYYVKAFKGKNTFFAFINKNELAKTIIERKFIDDQEVRFFDDDTFRVIVDNARLTSHKVAFWLLYDLGIEPGALTQLEKQDFIKEVDKETNEVFFKVNIRKDISKKTRQKRVIDILEPECNRLLNGYLDSLQEENLFSFNPPALFKALKLIVRQHRLKTKGDMAKEINLKDFRSSCATNMLRRGLTTDQVKVRLGHKFSSRMIDKYAHYLGIDQKAIRKEIYKANLQELLQKIDSMTIAQRKQQDEIKFLQRAFHKLENRYYSQKMDNTHQKEVAYDLDMEMIKFPDEDIDKEGRFHNPLGK